jgi:hypothetical protein
MINLAMMARSRLDADQPHSIEGFDLTPVDLTIMARFKLKASPTKNERTNP